MIHVVDIEQALIETDGARIVVESSGARRATLPVGRMSRLLVNSQCRISAAAISLMAAHGVGLLCMAGRFGRQPVHLLPASGDATLRLAQARLADNFKSRAAYATGLLHLKLIGCEVLLNNQPPTLEMRRGLAALSSARSKLLCGSMHLSNLRGIEGAAAAAYFEAFQTLFRTSIGFTGRNRRPPRDPVNVVLSLGYTLAYDEAIRALASAGLDAFMPGFHDLAGTRAALACDVTEAARAEVDGWALTLFSKGHLGSADFRMETTGACLLAKPARRMVYGQWAEKLQPLVRQHLDCAVAHYLHHLSPFRTAAIETHGS